MGAVHKGAFHSWCVHGGLYREGQYTLGTGAVHRGAVDRGTVFRVTLSCRNVHRGTVHARGVLYDRALYTCRLYTGTTCTRGLLKRRPCAGGLCTEGTGGLYTGGAHVGLFMLYTPCKGCAQGEWVPGGSGSAPGARRASFFDHSPPMPVFAPTSPNNLEYLSCCV